MRKARWTVPVILAVSSMAMSSCTEVAPTNDVVDIDTCPDPLACISDFERLADGGIHVIYRRSDGGVSDVPCPPPPNGCAVA